MTLHLHTLNLLTAVISRDEAVVTIYSLNFFFLLAGTITAIKQKKNLGPQLL